MVGQLFLAVPRGCLQFVIVVFPDHTHLLFLTEFFFKKIAAIAEHHACFLSLSYYHYALYEG